MGATTSMLIGNNGFEFQRRFFAAQSGSEVSPLPFLDALRPLNSEQVVAGDEQIGQRAGDEEPIGILRDAAVAHLGEAEHALDDPDRVLDAGADSRARTVDPAVVVTQVSVATATPLRKVFGVGRLG